MSIDTQIKIAKVFAIIMQILFLISFFAYCLSPIWMSLIKGK